MEGVCECYNGYGGDDCSVELRKFFAGSWTVADICPQTGTVYDSQISLDEGNSDGIRITNLYEKGFTTRATISDSMVMDIPVQVFGQWKISGSGFLDTTSMIISIDYLVDFDGGADTACYATFYKN